MSASSGSPHTYSKGQIVLGKVDRVLPFGAFVRLQDGTRAYIRRRELSLEGDADPRELLVEGQEIEATVHQLAEPGRSMELSHRATLPDPWKEFTAKFRKGDVVIATIRDLVHGGAFARIVAGIDGFIPLQELAPWNVERPEDVVWVGDRVEAEISQMDYTRRKVNLSIRRRMERLSRAKAITERLYQRTEAQTTGEVLPEEEPLSGLKEEWAEEIKEGAPVLVVEDDDAVREPLVKCLIRHGCLALGAKTASEALELCQREDYGLIMVDLDLPEVDGLGFTRALRDCGYSTPVAVMSSPEWIEEHLAEIQALEVAEVFPKPLELDEIGRLLSRLARGEKPKLDLQSLTTTTVAEARPSQRLADIMRSRQPLSRRFQEGLEQLVEATRAEDGVVFHLDPVSRKVSIVARAGTIPLNEEAVYSLVDSPVKDIIREGGEIWEGRVSQERMARFRKLVDLLPFESCIGVPIEACGQVEHALFLFHREPDAFSRYRLRDARAMASLFAVALESQALDRRVQDISRVFLSGHLAAAFGHEVYNKLSGLDLQFRNLCSDLDCLIHDHPGSQNSFELHELQRGLDKAVDTAMDLKRTVEGFRRLTETRKEGAVDLNEVIRQAESQLRSYARRAKVDVRLELAPDLPLAAGSGIGLQHVFLNLMLNAVQHMERKQDERRVLAVTTVYECGDGDRTVKARFSDTGPGIHCQLWEKIFALGFTTKPGGSGLGLYIARSLVESMGGRIFVEESLVPLGTAFVVELPAARASELWSVRSEGR